MGFDIQLGFLPQTFFLVLARFGGIVATVPFYGGTRTPVMVRAALAMMLALLITPLAPPEWVAAAGKMQNMPAILLGGLGEVILGAAVGLVVMFFTSVFIIAGDIIAHGCGLMMAKEIDPLSDVSNTMLANLLQMMFVLIVVLSDGHLILLKLVGDSFYKLPPQMTWVTQSWIYGMITLGSSMFEFGVRLAAPIIGIELLTNLGFALLARVAPDINILFLSMPVRLVAALGILGLVIHLSGYFFTSAIERMLAALAGILS